MELELGSLILEKHLSLVVSSSFPPSSSKEESHDEVSSSASWSKMDLFLIGMKVVHYYHYSNLLECDLDNYNFVLVTMDSYHIFNISTLY